MKSLFNECEPQPILELLIRHHLITPQQALQAQREKEPLEVLLSDGVVSEADLLRILAQEHHLHFIEKIPQPTPEAIREIALSEQQKWQVVPFLHERGMLHVAIHHPLNAVQQQWLLSRFHGNVRVHLCLSQELQRALHRPLFDGVTQSLSEPVPQLFTYIIHDALQMRATDIHFEPSNHNTVLRFRIDGVLSTRHALSASIYPELVNHIKILSRVDVAEKRLPQDGKLFLTLPSGQTASLRVSFVPTTRGEALALRLHNSSPLLTLQELGQEVSRCVEPLLKLNNGLILVVGPTGSGKTTTLHAMLEALQPRSIITIEDPLEKALPSVTQVSVSGSLSFAEALRASLRHSPQVIMLGEIRDPDTAQVALQASLTGHLVLSTLHTSSAQQAPLRLESMGLAKPMIASALRAVVAQRLVRKSCTCSNSHHCSLCNGSGFYGRTALVELWTATGGLVQTLQQSARQIISHKITTQAEIQRVLEGE